MQTYSTIEQFWKDYFDQRSAGTELDRWVIAMTTHTTDQAYRELRATNTDALGYQPTMLTLANPFTQESQDVIVRDVPTASFEQFRTLYQQRFISQLPHRFGLFHSDKKQADAIFDTWETFTNEWLERDGTSLIVYNLPILFDHVSDTMYWAWQQKGFDPCGTQRLIVTVFQYRTGRFAEVFITGVTDAEMSRIRLLVQSRLTLQIRELF